VVTNAATPWSVFGIESTHHTQRSTGRLFWRGDSKTPLIELIVARAGGPGGVNARSVQSFTKVGLILRRRIRSHFEFGRTPKQQLGVKAKRSKFKLGLCGCLNRCGTYHTRTHTLFEQSFRTSLLSHQLNIRPKTKDIFLGPRKSHPLLVRTVHVNVPIKEKRKYTQFKNKTRLYVPIAERKD
jgi:hypothetical protein